MKDTFCVGWSRVDITPDVPTPLDGMGNDYVRQANWIWPEKEEDRLKADLLVISDGIDWKNTVVFCPMDTLFIHEQFSQPAAQVIAQAIDIAPEHVFFCGSHTHCGVSMDEPDPSVLDYVEKLYGLLAQAAAEAVADLAPATVQIGKLCTQGMNAQRRFLMKDGSHRGTVWDKGYTSEEIAGYETRPDPILRAIRFVRQAQPDVLMVNFQLHLGFASSGTLGAVSADGYGTMRQLLEQQDPDCKFLYFQGAAGNMARSTRWKGDPWYDKMHSFDRNSYCAEVVRLLLEDMPMQTAAAGRIRVESRQLTVRQKKGRDILEQTHTLTLNAVMFGDIALCTAPAEMFSDSGLELRERSGYPMTFLCTCSNGNFGYLPVQACFDGESYSRDPRGDSFEVRVSKCEPGTVEKIVHCLLDALTT